LCAILCSQVDNLALAGLKDALLCHSRKKVS